MTNIEEIKKGAAIMFGTLNAVYQLHSVTELEPEEGDAAIESCEHCSEVADAIVHYPCPTVQILLEDMVTEEPAPDEAA